MDTFHCITMINHLKTFPNVQIYTTFDYLHHFVRISLEVSSTFPFSLQFTICVTLWKSPSKLLQTYISKYHSVQLLMSLCENLPQIFLYFTLLYTILLLASLCENLPQNFLKLPLLSTIQFNYLHHFVRIFLKFSSTLPFYTPFFYLCHFVRIFLKFSSNLPFYILFFYLCHFVRIFLKFPLHIALKQLFIDFSSERLWIIWVFSTW